MDDLRSIEITQVLILIAWAEFGSARDSGLWMWTRASHQSQSQSNEEADSTVLITQMSVSSELRLVAVISLLLTRLLSVSMDLGLHREETIGVLESPKDRERYRQTWFACLLIDRINRLAVCPIISHVSLIYTNSDVAGVSDGRLRYRIAHLTRICQALIYRSTIREPNSRKQDVPLYLPIYADLFC
jgi:hypothetical protein